MGEDKRNKPQRQATEQEGSQLCNPKLSDTRRRWGEKDEEKEKREKTR